MLSFERLLRRDDRRLTFLMRNAVHHRRLLELVTAQLPPELAPHCVGVAVEGVRLDLYADADVWATRLRYCQGELMAGLKKHARLTVSRVRVRVSPPVAVAPPAARQARLSHASATAIRASAAAVRDPALRDALRRLAAHCAER